MKFEKRFLEQQEKIKREFEAEIARKKEKQKSEEETEQEGGGSGQAQAKLKIPLVERTNSPPVPALREKVISKDL